MHGRPLVSEENLPRLCPESATHVKEETQRLLFITRTSLALGIMAVRSLVQIRVPFKRIQLETRLDIKWTDHVTNTNIFNSIKIVSVPPPTSTVSSTLVPQYASYV